MAKRISITPGTHLRLVPNRWQAKFASLSAEILMQEGRCSEVLQTISGLTVADLTGEFLTLKEIGKNKRKRSKKEENVDTTDGLNAQTSQAIDIFWEENSTQSSTSENPLSTVAPDEMTNEIIEIQENLF